MMKNNHDKVAHEENLERWVQRGFSTTRSTKKAVKLHDSNLEMLSKKANSPIKIQRAVEEEI